MAMYSFSVVRLASRQKTWRYRINPVKISRALGELLGPKEEMTEVVRGASPEDNMFAQVQGISVGTFERCDKRINF
jgi:hypothetical protein